MPHAIVGLGCTEAPGRGEEIHRLEEAGFPRPVRAEKQVTAITGLPVDLLEITKGTARNVSEQAGRASDCVGVALDRHGKAASLSEDSKLPRSSSA